MLVWGSQWSQAVWEFPKNQGLQGRAQIVGRLLSKDTQGKDAKFIETASSQSFEKSLSKQQALSHGF